MYPVWHFVNGVPQVGPPVTLGPLSITTTAVTSAAPIQSKQDIGSISNWDSGQFITQGQTNPNKGISFGFSTTDNYGYIYAREVGVSQRPLLIQPQGGGVAFGTSSAVAAAISVTSLRLDDTWTLNWSDVSLSRGAADVLTTPDRFVSTGPVAGIGYGVGAGGAVTQLTSRTTGVVQNTVTGQITLVSAAGSATYQSFTVTNSAVAATDEPYVWQVSGADIYEIHVTAVAAGSFRVTYRTTGGTTTEQPVFGFVLRKAVAS